MKNRTVLGIICIILAVATVFLVSPLVNRMTNGETTVLRLSEDVKQGAKITAKQIEAVNVKASTVPNNILKLKKDNSQGRSKAQFIANAITHYLYCSQTPDIPQNMPYNIKEMIVEAVG